MNPPQWKPSAEEIDTLLKRAVTKLALRWPKSDWIELRDSANALDPPDADGYVRIGWIVAIGEEDKDFTAWWHPTLGKGRLRRTRA